jgi:hypothetical protein
MISISCHATVINNTHNQSNKLKRIKLVGAKGRSPLQMQHFYMSLYAI